MTIEELQQALASKVNPLALPALSGRISLHCEGLAQDGSKRLHLELLDGQLHWLGDDASTDATFYFNNCEQALALLTGSADVMSEFMAGRFRSNGYLLWAFPLLGLFRA